MNGVNRTVVILGAATLAFGSASAFLYNDLRETRAQSVALQARVAELEKAAPARAQAPREKPALPVNPFGPPVTDANPPPPKAAPSPVAIAAPKAAVAQAGAVTPPFTVMASPGFGSRMGGGWEQSRRLLEDPDYRDAMKRQQKMMMPRMYPELQQVLQIDERQANELFDLLAEQQMRQMSEQRGSPFSTRNSPPDDAAVRAWQESIQKQQAANENEVAALLGDAGYQQWKNYKNTMPARSQIRELRSTLESAGIPLQLEQSEKLVAAITAQQQNQFRGMQGAVGFVPGGAYSMRPMVTAPSGGQVGQPNRPVDRTAMFEQQIERTRTQQQQLRSTVAPHLSSQQLEQFERMQAQQLEMQEINLKMMRAQAAAEARGDLPPSNQNGMMTSQGMIVER